MFLLALKYIFLFSDWPLFLPWFWFYDNQPKSALFVMEKNSVGRGVCTHLSLKTFKVRRAPSVDGS